MPSNLDLEVRKKQKLRPRRIQICLSMLLLVIGSLQTAAQVPMNLDILRGVFLTKDLLLGHGGRLQAVIRMRCHSFFALTTWLLRNTDLNAARFGRSGAGMSPDTPSHRSDTVPYPDYNATSGLPRHAIS
ncbi:hypothetical protein V8F06_001697 [Rhypophila decipiens]